jgi:hypothetical protein
VAETDAEAGTIPVLRSNRSVPGGVGGKPSRCAPHSGVIVRGVFIQAEGVMKRLAG